MGRAWILSRAFFPAPQRGDSEPPDPAWLQARSVVRAEHELRPELELLQIAVAKDAGDARALVSPPCPGGRVKRGSP